MTNDEIEYVTQCFERQLRQHSGPRREVQLNRIEADPAVAPGLRWSQQLHDVVADHAWKAMMRYWPEVECIVVCDWERHHLPFPWLAYLGRANVNDVVKMLGVASAADVTLHPWTYPRDGERSNRLDEWTIPGAALARGGGCELSITAELREALVRAGARVAA